MRVKYIFMNLAHIHIISNQIKVHNSCMQSNHSLGIRVSKNSQRNFLPNYFPLPFYLDAIKAYYLLPYHQTVIYKKHIIYYFITLIPSIFPAYAHTCQPHVPNINIIIFINFKSNFTNNHVINHS